MKNIFSKNYFLVCLFFIGCLPNQKIVNIELAIKTPACSSFQHIVNHLCVADPVCTSAQHILNHLCVADPVCTSSQHIVNHLCVADPVCTNTQQLANHICVADPLCTNTQQLVNHICVADPEIEVVTKSQLTSVGIKIEITKKTYTTSKSTRSVSTLNIDLNKKLNSVVIIKEKDANVLVSESINSSNNLTAETSKDKYKINTTFDSSLSNKILKIEEINKYTSFDNITFNLRQVNNIDINTGLNKKEAITIAQLPPDKISTINSIKTTIKTTGTYLNNIEKIIQKTKTLSLLDNSYVEKNRTYTFNASTVTFVESISECGPTPTVIIANKIRTEISVSCRIEAGKTIIEKKIVKSLFPDGLWVDGQTNGVTVTGSSLTTGTINGSTFDYLIKPFITDKKRRPVRSCDILAVEKAINAQSTAASGTWMQQRNVSLRFADRNYVISNLVKVFGVSVTGSVAFINNLNNIYGGTFDMYDVAHDDADKRIVANTTPEGYPLTASDRSPNGSLIGPLNPIRLATTTCVCEDIVKNNAYVFNAIKNVTGEENLTLATIPYPFKADFAAAHALFYPSDPISQNTSDAFICVADSEERAIDQWRNIFLTLCITPEWQIP